MRPMSIPFRRFTVCSVAVLCLAGCGGSGTGLTSIDGYLKKAAPFPKVRPDGVLTNDPPPVTQAVVNRQPAGSPQRLIYGLWYFGQVGQPNIVSFFEPAVQRSVGLQNIIGAFSLARDYMLSTWPEIIQEVPSGGVMTLNVLVFSSGGPPSPETFTLRKHNGRWLIAYDSFLDSNLRSYVQSLKDAGQPKPTPAGAAAGAAAAEAYRNAFASTLHAVVSAAGKSTP